MKRVRRMHKRTLLLTFGSLALLSASLFYLSISSPAVASCGEKLGPATVSEFNLPSLHFGGVTKFRLLGDKFPNGITALPDGSVWFGEQNVPALAHLYPDGKLLEYAWPISYSPSTTSIWGVVQWNGRIWASDALGGQIVGLDPSTATVYAVKLSEISAFPYTITVGPDGALWFTELFASKLGRIDPQCRLKEFAITSNFGGTPTQIWFKNGTSGYYVDAGNASSGLGTLLSFDPNHFSPQPIYGAYNLRAPSSLVLNSDGIWVAQHATSALAFYDFKADKWVLYPTSPISYAATSLPYFVAANGSQVWFNEHYANHMATINAEHSLLTEYSLSDPPANKTIRIDNALTFSLGNGKAWFTEVTANYVGYVDTSYRPTFTISSAGSPNIDLKPGSNVTLAFTVAGESHSPITVQFADTENITERPQNILVTANVTEIQSLNGTETLLVRVAASKALQLGDYTILVTLTDGLENQGAYVKLHVVSQGVIGSVPVALSFNVVRNVALRVACWHVPEEEHTNPLSDYEDGNQGSN